ncbi:MAG: glycosyltransferase family 4 protein [Alphaproteobacteria bacterium]
MRIAFYAPLKPPDHATPSGDRRVARLYLAALRQAGHDVFVASDYRSYQPKGDDPAVANGASATVDLERFEADLWFTYHVYYKAPDYLGPVMKQMFEIPYVIAEPSHAPKRAGGPWNEAHGMAMAAIRIADLVLCPTRLDIECVAELRYGRTPAMYFPPFLDCAPYVGVARERAGFGLPADRKWLLAVGMMRPGDKLESYRQLGQAIALLPGDDWCLAVAGDGPARAEVEAALGRRDRVHYLGALDPDPLARLYAAADLMVWPAVGEAYGMALLEAQASGLPVVAGRQRGVPDVVGDGIGGRLVPPDDPSALAEAVRALLDDDGVRARLGAGAAAHVRGERDLPAAAAKLDMVLRGLSS